MSRRIFGHHHRCVDADRGEPHSRPALACPSGFARSVARPAHLKTLIFRACSKLGKANSISAWTAAAPAAEGGSLTLREPCSPRRREVHATHRRIWRGPLRALWISGATAALSSGDPTTNLKGSSLRLVQREPTSTSA